MRSVVRAAQADGRTPSLARSVLDALAFVRQGRAGVTARLALALLSLTALLLPLSHAPLSPTAHAQPDGAGATAGTGATAGASASALTTSIPAHRRARNIAVITLKGEIDAGGRLGNSIAAASVQRRIRTAARAGADAIVLELDTPGGEVGASLRIAMMLKESPVQNTVAWVRPQALSGGAIVALAAREIIVSDPASFGDAMPVMFTPSGARAVTDRELIRKVLPPLISELLDSARRHNDAFGAYVRDEYLMQAIVANDVELWWVRNRATGQEMAIDRAEFQMLFPGRDTGGITRLAPAPGAPARGVPSDPSLTSGTAGIVPAGSQNLALVAQDVASRVTRKTTRPVLTPADAGAWDLVDKITDGSAPATFNAMDMAHYNLAVNRIRTADGSTVLQPIRTDEDLRAFFGAENVRRLDQTWSEGLVLFLTTPWVRGVLIAIFLLSLFVEMTHPGAILPGVLSLVSLCALLAPPMLIGMASWWEVAAILAGIVLIGVEIFVVPGFGVAGFAGLALLFVGLLATFIPGGHSLFPSGGAEGSEVLRAALWILAGFVTAGVGVYFVAKYFGSVPLLGKLVLQDPAGTEQSFGWSPVDGADAPAARVGQLGRTTTPMHPAGRVEVDGRLIDAVSEVGYLPSGTQVRVVSVDGIRVGVEPLGQTTGARGADVRPPGDQHS